jgi:superfamily I DNA/RNA helicase
LSFLLTIYRDNSKVKSQIRNNGISRIHLTPFKSSKGLEFDTVIIPDFQEFAFWKSEHKYAVKENDYYVGMTRAKSNLFLFTENISVIDYVDPATYTIETI